MSCERRLQKLDLRLINRGRSSVRKGDNKREDRREAQEPT